jgi:murein DD-endopeptidase MepM/ murein hydrolase activator NlpD
MGGFMAKKFFSIIIVPHSKTSFKTISLSKKAAKALAGTGTFLLLALAVLLIDYFSMTVLRGKYRNLRQEAAAQQAKIADYETYVKRLKTTIANFESYAKKLNIMAGLRSPEVIKDEAGLGGGDPEPEDGTDLQGPSAPQDVTLSSIQNLAQKAESVEKNLNSLVGFFEEQTARLATTPTIWPTIGWLSSPFGNRIDPFTGKAQFHRGIDIATNFGNPIVASADGIVASVSVDRALGKMVIISHGSGVSTYYGHLEKFAVKSGAKVKRGDVIGYVGKTGRALGPHLHYEIRIDGRSVNPRSYILED